MIEAHAVSADSPEEREYLEFLNCLKHVPLTQSPQWPQVKRGWGVQRFIARDDQEQVIGTAQLLHIQDQRTGEVFAYIPRGPVCEYTNAEGVRALITAAIAWSRDHQVRTLRVDPPWVVERNEDGTACAESALDALADLAPATVRRYPEKLLGQPPIEMVGTIPDGDFDAWFMTLQSRRRSAIRKGIRQGVNAYISSERELIEPLYELIVGTAQRQQITHRPKQYLYDLYDAFRSEAAPKERPASIPTVSETDVFFSVGEYEGKIKSLALNIVCTDTVHWLYVGNELDVHNLNSSAVTVAETFHEAARRGIPKVNMTGAFSLDPQECSLLNFKRKFCGDAGTELHAGEIDFHL